MPNSPVPRVAHITVTGEFMTETARSLFLSDRPANAWRLLTRGLQGDGIEACATAIIDGKKKLVGDSTVGIGVKPERKRVAAAVHKAARSIYAGRVRIDGAWYRPRAEVIDFGPDDVPPTPLRQFEDHPYRRAEDGHLGEILPILRNFFRSRVAFYAREGEKIVEVLRTETMPLHSVKVGARTFLIFEPVGEPPFWWDEIRSPGAALEDFFAAGRTLGDESWEARFGSRGRSDAEEDDVAARVEEERVTPQTAEQEEIRIALEEVSWQRRLREIRERVLAQAAGDHFEMAYTPEPEEGREPATVILSVPRAPFECWALRRTGLAHLAPPWVPVSPSGMKLTMDDPCHTDWLVAVGFNPRVTSAYSGPIHEASMSASFALQERLGHYECMVLSRGDQLFLSGVVGKEIAVLPDLHPDRLDEVLRSQAVLTQAGGELSHLAQVATERRIPILLVPDALRRFPAGSRVNLYPDEGVVILASRLPAPALVAAADDEES